MCVSNCPFIKNSHSAEAASGKDSGKLNGDHSWVGVPSRVMHMQSCSVTSQRMRTSYPLGKSANLLMLVKKNQSFIKVNMKEVAKAVANYYNPWGPSCVDSPSIFSSPTSKNSGPA